MIGGISFGELAFLAAVIIAGGIVTGILAGLFGIGGGAIIVPVLYEVFRVLDVPEEVRMQLCVGTSMAIIVPTNVRSYLVHRALRRGADRRGARVGDPVGGRRGRRRADCRAVAGRGAQDRVCRHHRHHRIEALVGRDDWRIASELPGRVGDDGLRIHPRAWLVA